MTTTTDDRQHPRVVFTADLGRYLTALAAAAQMGGNHG